MSTLTVPDSCEKLLAQMVSFETVNTSFGGPDGGEARLAVHLEKLAEAWGLRTRRQPVSPNAFNLLVWADAADDAEWLLFDSHLDTVSIAGMTVPALELTRQGDRLYGRGACDTKGSGAAMLWALQRFARETKSRHRKVGLVFTVDEESGMQGAQAFAEKELKHFEKLRGVIVGEPTRLRPVVAHNGAFRWRSITRGVAAHSADPGKGRSAISAMVRVIQALESRMIPLANRESPLTGRAAASINVIRGGSAANIIPDYCEIIADRRLVPGETAEQVLAERAAALEGLPVENDSEYLAPPLPPENSEHLHAWLAPILSSLGHDATPTGVAYATNASHYAAAGAQVLVLGPGDIAQAHTKDEWLERDALAAAAELYLAVMAGRE